MEMNQNFLYFLVNNAQKLHQGKMQLCYNNSKKTKYFKNTSQFLHTKI
jgi:hypothetical protein